jgi:ADP-L-glycero-D-manno-heptose 6-epimerase
MIVVTGARGFIASNLIKALNEKGLYDLLLVDENEKTEKEKNLASLQFTRFIDRNLFLDWFQSNHHLVDFVFHLGAKASTTEQDIQVLNKWNLNYSKTIFEICTQGKIPLVYASSAATYGNGEQGYDDKKSIKPLKPLNLYGESKQNFDLWVLEQENTPPFWVGLKFFNVYGPLETHKNRMASVVFHAYHQITQSGKMNIFQSHKEGIEDGEQKRDFIYVKDVADVCLFFYYHQKNSGLYNLGTGKADSFNNLTKAVFKALEEKENIQYIPIPTDIRDKYQYFTEAKMEKLREAGYKNAFTTLEDGVKDYVQNYLIEK